MPARDLFDVYRRVLGTTGSDEVWWWYFGGMTVHLDGLPAMPVIEAETIMAYKIEDLSPDSFRIHWQEIGCFRDPLTGAVPTTWTNPVTGAVITPPKSFREGPGHYTLTRQSAGVRLDIVQPHAVMQDATVSMTELPDGRVMVTQLEHKLRGFPQADGTMPKEGSPAETRLSFFANAADLDKPSVPAQGIYSFDLDAMSPWLGFGNRRGRTSVRGVIAKGTPSDTPNATARAELERIFPDFFAGKR